MNKIVIAGASVYGIENQGDEAIRAISWWLHRSLTLIKRYLVYRLLNTLIIRLKLGGDNLFFVARKGGSEKAGEWLK